jgi:hypothetical protein
MIELKPSVTGEGSIDSVRVLKTQLIDALEMLEVLEDAIRSKNEMS